MADPENPNQPLLTAQAPANVTPEQGARSSSRAYKVAGFTLLACILIAGQAMIAYFLLSQRGDIKSLQEQNNNLRTDMKRGGSASVPIRMQLPMDTLPMLADDTVDEEASTGTPAKTDCQLEAEGQKPVELPGFRPRCDARGFYRPKQCYQGHCWCVNPATGLVIPGDSNGDPFCGTRVLAGSMNKMLSLDDIEG
ncbi:uncharacterized protein V6R79_009545 [Siganus canaliculatus]